MPRSRRERLIFTAQSSGHGGRSPYFLRTWCRVVVDYTMSCKVGENAIQHHVVVTLDPVPALETAEFVGDVIQRLALEKWTKQIWANGVTRA